MSNLSPAAAANIRYQEAHLGDSRVPEIVASIIICLPLAFMAVALRFLCRRIGKVPIKADDWWIVVALVFTTAFVVCEIYVTHLGLGRHAVLLKQPVHFAKVLDPSLLSSLSVADRDKAVVAKEVIYNPAIVAVKTSILLLYRRIFTDKGLNKTFTLFLWFAGLFTLAYSLVGVFTVLFHCMPVNSLWDPTIKATCIDFEAVLIIVACLNIGTDILVLCLPMPLLWRLKMPVRRKFQLMGIFSLGGFACIASIIRVPYIARTSLIDPSWSDTYGAIWSVVELTMGIVSACLPTLRPLFLHVFNRPVTKVTGSKISDASSKTKVHSLKHPYLQVLFSGNERSWKLSKIDSGDTGTELKATSIHTAEVV